MRGRLSRAVVSTGLITVLTLGLVGPASAQDAIDDLEQQLQESERERSQLSDELGNLDDQKSGLQSTQGDLNASLEGLDADISEKVTELNDLQSQLPAAQQAVTDAEGRVEAAQAEVESLNERVRQAEGRRAEIQAEIASAEQQIAESHDEAGQIANQAYKQGGVSQNLSFILGLEDSSLPEAMGLAQQALRIQDTEMSTVSQQNSTDRNAEARLAAVEEEIRDLKAEAEKALAREQQARDEAADAKKELDQMVSSTEQLTEELKAERPRIESQIEENQRKQEQVNSEIAERQSELVSQESQHSELQEEHQQAVEEAERKRREAQEAERRAREAEEAAARAAANEREKEEAREARADAEQANEESAEADRKVTETQSSSSSSSSSSWGLIRPLNANVTSGFGWRPTPAGSFDYGGQGGYVHTGIDYGGGCGLPIRAAADGTVWNADWSVWTSGRRVVLSHGVVKGRALATKYHHMTRYVVSPGQSVSQGDVIGYTGTTGNSTGCHLHFETIVDGSAVNPSGLL